MNVVDVLASPWAIQPEKLSEITAVYDSHLQNGRGTPEEIEARASVTQKRDRRSEVIGGVAVIPVQGVLAKRMNLMTRISGGSSTQIIERDFLVAMESPDSHAIVGHADTPGGAVDGTAELAQTIFNNRGAKPIYTVADGLMASGGVWIGTAADYVFATSPTTHVGSIGVIVQHIDRSGANRARGLVVTDIYAGKYKRIDTANAPLSDAGRSYIQSHIDTLYSLFVEAVAKHRASSTKQVLERMADGRTFIGAQAADVGLIDGFARLDDLVAELAR